MQLAEEKSQGGHCAPLIDMRKKTPYKKKPIEIWNQPNRVNFTVHFVFDIGRNGHPIKCQIPVKLANVNLVGIEPGELESVVVNVADDRCDYMSLILGDSPQ